MAWFCWKKTFPARPRLKSSETPWPSGSANWIAPRGFCRFEGIREVQRFFAIINPAAGAGRAAQLAPQALARLRELGLAVDAASSSAPNDGVQLARQAYREGYRRFIAVGGDGTAHEVLNGVFPLAAASQRVSLGLLPLGT